MHQEASTEFHAEDSTKLDSVETPMAESATGNVGFSTPSLPSSVVQASPGNLTRRSVNSVGFRRSHRARKPVDRLNL